MEGVGWRLKEILAISKFVPSKCIPFSVWGFILTKSDEKKRNLGI
jgi:hypothetical protein